ncbi:MAG: MarR family transcriptional regulator [Chthoniobacterales bacterium]|nr:MarR family transcriptional regulator [Chthoniobacterales bacterium]
MTKADYEALASFRYALRKFLDFSRRAAAEQGLAPQQYLALLEIKGFPGHGQVTVGNLAERLHVAAHSAVGLVNRLQERGLVKRKQSKEDRRCIHVCLTNKGESLLQKLAVAHRNELKIAGPLLAKLLEHVSSGQDSAGCPVSVPASEASRRAFASSQKNHMPKK